MAIAITDSGDKPFLADETPRLSAIVRIDGALALKLLDTTEPSVSTHEEIQQSFVTDKSRPALGCVNSFLKRQRPTRGRRSGRMSLESRSL
jgi:hypothetical protein